MNNGLVAISSVALGAGIMYVVDPDEGRRRRARIREALVHASHVLNAAEETTTRDLEHRLTGLAARTLTRIIGETTPTDEVLVARVRSRLGRLVSHPGAIDVTASNGAITVSGPIFEREVEQLLRRVGQVPGVTTIENRLDPRPAADGEPALQGPGPLSISRGLRWTPTGRLMAGVIGLALVALSSARGTARGATVGIAGVRLLEHALLGART